MEFQPREQIIEQMNQSMEMLMSKYNLEDIGVFEEQGEGENYYMGYTVRKDKEVYMIHKPFRKNEEGQLSATEKDWIIETEEGDLTGYRSLDEVFTAIEQDLHH